MENAEDRQTLYRRFRQSQATAQVDPWAELARPAARGDFIPLETLE